MTTWSAVDMGVPMGATLSVAFGASSNGAVIVGSSDFTGDGNTTTFRWTSGGGFQNLGSIPGGPNPSPGGGATGVSADGTIVVGSDSGGAAGGPFFGTFFNAEAFRWTSGGGMVGLGFLGSGDGSAANAISADGTMIVGSSQIISGFAQQNFPFKWTSGGGMVALPLLAGAIGGAAQGVSSDGTVIVGNSTDPIAGDIPVKWTSGGAAVAIPFAGGNTTGVAKGVSADGTQIVGFMGNSAFLCNAGTTTLLGAPFTQTGSQGNAISSNGLILAGSGSGSPGSAGLAWLWTLAGGFVDLPPISGFSTTTALGISGDGSRPVGDSTFPVHATYWAPVATVRSVSLADLWFSNTSTFVDLTDVTNRRKFISDSGGTQDLGPHGAQPFGGTPAVFLTRTTTPDTFALNQGAGGAFTISGGSLGPGLSNPPPTLRTHVPITVLGGATNRHAVLGDYRNGNLYAFNPATYLDNGSQRKWVRRWRALPGSTSQSIRYSYLTIDMQTGAGVPPDTNPQVMLRWSDDGGHSWSNYRLLSVGRSGETAFTVKANRLGSSARFGGADRIFELSSTDPFKVGIVDAEVDAS